MFWSLDKLPLKLLSPTLNISLPQVIGVRLDAPQSPGHSWRTTIWGSSYQSQEVSQQIPCDTSGFREVPVQNFPMESDCSYQPAAVFCAKRSFVKACCFNPMWSSLKCISAPVHYDWSFQTALSHCQNTEILYYSTIKLCCCSLYCVSPSGLKHKYELHNTCLENRVFTFLPMNN